MSTKKVHEGPWREATTNTTTVVIEEGDSLNVLRRVRKQYYSKADRIVLRRTNPETQELSPKYRKLVNNYRAQGDLIGNLIPEDKQTVEAQQ